ncbi:hypothetical protein AVEN_275205-1 [Araneus ventricosus]|uniref:Uncharacterized protein n=1 Tax=Araneus ventricosus TaxID=182803 RepID=A0A4Y2NRZ0_ARAVE|nr:hypothetical protein AVEN_275205-1 [Araneus ventricosus]
MVPGPTAPSTTGPTRKAAHRHSQPRRLPWCYSDSYTLKATPGTVTTSPGDPFSSPLSRPAISWDTDRLIHLGQKWRLMGRHAQPTRGEVICCP